MFTQKLKYYDNNITTIAAVLFISYNNVLQCMKRKSESDLKTPKHSAKKLKGGHTFLTVLVLALPTFQVSNYGHCSPFSSFLHSG